MASSQFRSHKASKVLAELRKNRNGFRDAIKKQTGANESAWTSAKIRLETEWSAFEAEVKKYVERKYVERYGKQFELQAGDIQAPSCGPAEAWHDAADKLTSAASEFASWRRDEIETNVNRIEVDAVAAEEKLLKLNQAGNQSWSALIAALTETRAVFDRANQAATEAFKRAT